MNGFTCPDPLEYIQALQTKTRAEKRQCIENMRFHISQIFPDAGWLYKSTKSGELTKVAYGIVQPVLTESEKFSRVQLPTHRFTEWENFWHPHERLDSMQKVIVRAYFYVEYGYPLRRAFDRGQPLPDYLFYTYNERENEKKEYISFATGFKQIITY